MYLLSVKLLRFFVNRENKKTEAQVECTIINRLYAINWISYFLWYILFAFVIVPFGNVVEDWLNAKFNLNALYTVNWHKIQFDMSTALVTPLLITQALNLLIDTALPNAYYVRWLQSIRHFRMWRAKPSDAMLALSEVTCAKQAETSKPTCRKHDPTISISKKIEVPCVFICPCAPRSRYIYF